MHIFSDSPEKAYGTVTYIKLVQNGSVSCSFVLAKTRFAAINKRASTIPRLKLETATRAARLFKSILPDIKI